MEQTEDKITYTKHGWIDLSVIPKKGKLYDWIAAKGISIPFCYDGIEAFVVVKEKLDHQTLLVDVPNYCIDKKVKLDRLKENTLSGCFKPLSYDFKYNVGYIINNVKIIKQIRQKTKSGTCRAYECECLTDGFVWIVDECHLSSGGGCPVCSNNAVMKGVNDIATTRPDIAKLFKNKEYTYKYSQYSHQKVDFVCPFCNSLQYKTISNVSKNGLHCEYCSDGISYPNKFVRAFLSQLFNKEDICNEYTFDWSKCIPTSFSSEGKDMIYDEYIPMFNMIIENHGEQHYKETRGNIWSFENIKENDTVKKHIAIENGVYYYIELDCSKSETEYIKNSIMNSELPNVFNFEENDIDWIQCGQIAASSNIVEIAKQWNNGQHDPKILANVFGVHIETAKRYLKKAESLNLLNSPFKNLKSIK